MDRLRSGLIRALIAFCVCAAAAGALFAASGLGSGFVNNAEADSLIGQPDYNTRYPFVTGSSVFSTNLISTISGGKVEDIAIAMVEPAEDHPRVAYAVNYDGTGEIHFARFDGSGWADVIFDYYTPCDTPLSLSLAMNQVSDEAHLVYAKKEPAPYTTKIYYAKESGGGMWDVNPITPSLDGFKPSLVLDPNSFPTAYVAYCTGAPSTGFNILRTDNGDGWDAPTLIEHVSTDTPYLSAGYNGSLQAAYKGTNMLRFFDGGNSFSIDQTPSTSDLGRFVSLRRGEKGLDGLGDSFAAAYYDGTEKNLRYAYPSAKTSLFGEWDTAIIDSTGDVGRYCQLDFSDTGEPRLIYYDATNKNVKLAARNAGTWTTETPSAGINREIPPAYAMAVDKYDNIVVAYFDEQYSINFGETTAAVIWGRKHAQHIGNLSDSSYHYPSYPVSGFEKQLVSDPIGLSSHSAFLYVSDGDWHRVLVFAVLPSGVASSEALFRFGQGDYFAHDSGTSAQRFREPRGLANDQFGNLWVADARNHRVLRFNSAGSGIPGNNTADFVIGQAGFTTHDSGTSQTMLNEPSALAFDAFGNLWVSDFLNHRVLRFDADAAGLVTDTSADLVLGQANFTSRDSGTTRTSFRGPAGLAIDPVGNLWVADFGNNRVLFFSSNHDSYTVPTGPALLTDTVPDALWGQPDYLGRNSGTGISSSFFPLDVSISRCGYVYVTETYANDTHFITDDPFEASLGLGGNNRVLRFDPNTLCGYTNTFDPDFVIGQGGSFTASDTGTSSTKLMEPVMTCFDLWGNLWVADADNHRVLMFLDPPDHAVLDSEFGHCFVASALWGAGSKEAGLLRKFRDHHLLTNRGGRAFVRLYMALSPSLVKAWERGNCDSCLSLWQKLLTPLLGLAAFSLKYGMGPLLLLLSLPALLALFSPWIQRRARP